MIAVLVLHDEGLVRSALEGALGCEPDLALRATGSTADALRFARVEPPDVVVTDARRAVSSRLRQALAGTGARWVVQVRAEEAELIADVLLAGAGGLFSDRSGGAALVEAVRHVAAGRGWLCPDLVPVLVRDFERYHRRRVAARARLQGLGEADVRLLALVARGLSNAEIAGELHLAVSTVKDYVGSLLGRLGTTRAEAIALAVRADLGAQPLLARS